MVFPVEPEGVAQLREVALELCVVVELLGLSLGLALAFLVQRLHRPPVDVLVLGPVTSAESGWPGVPGS
jgi:hypothetical protein